MNIYVASGLENRARAAMLISCIEDCGHRITYDWTKHGDVRDKGEDAMCATACNEVEGVANAELLIVLLPGGKGTHTELGIALATRAHKRIWMWSEDTAVFGGGSATCVFYHHPAIERLSCSFEALQEKIRLL